MKRKKEKVFCKYCEYYSFVNTCGVAPKREENWLEVKFVGHDPAKRNKYNDCKHFLRKS